MSRTRLPASIAIAALLLTAPSLVFAQTSDDLFNDSTLQQIRLVMSSRDLQTMKAAYLANTSYPADVQWRNLRVRNVAVRARGSGSRSATKLGLQIDFAHYSTSQRFLGMKWLVLDNLWQDPAMVREHIAMRFYTRMGQPAPRESFCKLYINDVYYGVYGVVEDITSELLQRAVSQPDAYLFEYHYKMPFYGEYLGDDFEPYKQLFEPRSHTKEADTILYSPLVDLFREVNEPDDAVWRDRVGTYIDLQQFVTYVAIETYLSEADGILSPVGMSNFYIYRDKGSTMHRLVPWDKDRTFSEYDSSVLAGADLNVIFRRALAYPDLQALYLDTLAACASSATSVNSDGELPWMDGEIARVVDVISAAAADDPLKPFTNDDFASAVSYLRTFAIQRPSNVLQQVAQLRAPGSN
jgi:spore coat protein CotH